MWVEGSLPKWMLILKPSPVISAVFSLVSAHHRDHSNQHKLLADAIKGFQLLTFLQRRRRQRRKICGPGNPSRFIKQAGNQLPPRNDTLNPSRSRSFISVLSISSFQRHPPHLCNGTFIFTVTHVLCDCLLSCFFPAARRFHRCGVFGMRGAAQSATMSQV